MTDAARRASLAYVVLYGLFTLGASVIWAINTVFLIRVGGLDLFQAMLVNSVFTIAQMAFEVPTGVLADTLGRRFSIVGSMLILAVSTMIYVVAPSLSSPLVGFFAASTLLGLGYTMQTGAIDAWVVDAMDHAGYTEPKDRVFAWGQISSGAGMLAGSLLGGILGQLNLSWPYLARTALLGACFFLALATVRDEGFEPRPLRWASLHTETKRVFSAGVRYGWRSPAVRPLLLVSGLTGVFFMFGFYAWQPYILRLVGHDYVWLLGVVQAASSAASILGNLLVTRLVRIRPTRLLSGVTAVNAVCVLGIGLVGIIWKGPGYLPAAIAVVLWLVWGVAYGVSMPVRMSYINQNVPSSERATVLSLDAFFLDGGSAVGQPALGWVSDRVSMSAAWVIGSVFVAAAVPLYAQSGNAADDGSSAR